MNSPKVRLITTQDGSSSLYLPSLDETYHSTRGAWGESIHVYIENGINTLTNTEIKLLEVGFGTGLNALLTYQFALKKQVNVSYHTLEPFPLEKEIYENLGYASSDEEQKIFHKIHALTMGNFQVSSFFHFYRYQKTLEDFSSDQTFDIIYYDAFAPSRQPEIWSKENLSKCLDLLNPGGIMVTYCAQGQFKRDLATVGFQVEVLPGGMGKKEMVRARKPA
ncbi:MAG: tRNA (5-methylaminomethyl-2-thiouridine)(34)-methyltransferase MnmD [Cyclobacteriaceae bacterium]